ncbi:tyrosine-type recombinase/integrase [Mycolicibacterium conceptionense]|uniref:tyrosine-type recombinase/integrase n=1 Tax=Mycolicibacterium conceptionense TaxID=451644 RepID=UPI003204DD93
MNQWDELIAGYVGYLVAIGRPKTTRRLRRWQVAYLQQSLNLPVDRITEDDLLGWFEIHEEWKPETRRSYRAGVRGFFAWAHKAGLISENPSLELPQVKVPRAVPQPVPDIVFAEAVAAAPARTALMLRLAGEVGLRRAEVAKVHTRDLRHLSGGAQLLVHGKGARERIVPISGDLATKIAAGPAGYGATTWPAAGWLFPSPHGGHVTAAWVGTLCSDAIPGVWTMHKARHRFASKAYRGTRNIRAVQELLGHSNLAITERYTAVDDDEMRAAMMAAAA